MPEYLIFFNQQWVPDYPEEDFVEIGVESKAVVAEMKDAGVLVFAGGLEETTALASADATSGERVITDGPYAETNECLGGFTVVDVADERPRGCGRAGSPRGAAGRRRYGPSNRAASGAQGTSSVT